jgi:hypothetical protein
MGSVKVKLVEVGDSVRKGPSHGDHSARTRDMSRVSTNLQLMALLAFHIC